MRQEPWSSGDGVLPWMRESSRFTQNPSWSQVLAAVVWQRMLKILGDINKIADPLLHVEAMSCLQSIWKSLFDVGVGRGRRCSLYVRMCCVCVYMCEFVVMLSGMYVYVYLVLCVVFVCVFCMHVFIFVCVCK